MGLESARHKAVELAWEQLQGDWQSEEAHRRFVALCVLHGALAEAGRLYRALREREPARAAELDRRLQAVMSAALDQLSATRTVAGKPKKRGMWLIVGACGFLVIYAILALLRVRSQ